MDRNALAVRRYPPGGDKPPPETYLSQNLLLIFLFLFFWETMEALPGPTSHSSIPHSYSTVQVVVSTEQLCLVPVSIRDPHCWHLLKGQPLLQGACGLNLKGLAADSFLTRQALKTTTLNLLRPRVLCTDLPGVSRQWQGKGNGKTSNRQR